ncbi:MAG: helix-turn-helix domain-containing protein [Flavobacteriaceae bacterium]|nr:helix-turn-helix domain-containing protein [Flavobacteriaceae bacterium]
MQELPEITFIKPEKNKAFTSALYQVYLFGDTVHFELDHVEHVAEKGFILFLTPYQKLIWTQNAEKVMCLNFHGDFYCIEYHKKEVACNGLLFNNIYDNPCFRLTDKTYEEVGLIFQKITTEIHSNQDFSESVVKSYLQLILALCSKEKKMMLTSREVEMTHEPIAEKFEKLLDSYFLKERGVSFYANELHLTPSALSRKIKEATRKTPSQLIKERIILEAKKQLHLTYKSVKEIAAELGFEDEFYFSRYFKKEVEISPIHYRDKVGIALVASRDLN